MNIVAIDVGTGSARAGVFDAAGRMLAVAKRAIAMHHPAPGWAEQSQADIWAACCACVREAVAEAGIDPESVAALGVDATCSLALMDTTGTGLELSPGFDILVWMDQRATEDAAAINATGAQPLEYVGGKMSPEMQMPKLRWLKRHRPDLWARLGYAGDLADWLTWRATGSMARSVCTLTCKWGFLGHNSGWDHGFLAQIGLEDVLARAALPASAQPIGAPVGTLSPQAAAELGLGTGCIVASGMIDAHAGALAGFAHGDTPEQTMVLVAGTSNCHMVMSSAPRMIPGVWGPYRDVVTAGLWLNEGGQTTTGAALDHLVALLRGADAFGPDVHGNVAAHLMAELEAGRDPTGGVVMLTDFLGNRSPFADPSMRGALCGLTIEDPAEGFAHLYAAACFGIAAGTRAIIEAMNARGYAIDRIVLTGGHGKNPLLTRLYADVTGCDLIVPDCPEMMLRGGAICALAATGAGIKPAQQRLAATCKILPALPGRHEDQYARFKTLYAVASGA